MNVPPNSGTRTGLCSVDGCKSDLNKCRIYYRRHRVCEAHSKTPVVLVNGQEKRFCQQCSKFHLLVEFDDVKRSCRRRLDGHNKRRRKLPMECIYSSSRSIMSNLQGTRLLQFGIPQINGSTTRSQKWPVTIRYEAGTITHSPIPQLQTNKQQRSNPTTFTLTYKGKRWSPPSQPNHFDTILSPETGKASPESVWSNLYSATSLSGALYLLSRTHEPKSYGCNSSEPVLLNNPVTPLGMPVAQLSASHSATEECIGCSILVPEKNIDPVHVWPDGLLEQVSSSTFLFP